MAAPNLGQILASTLNAYAPKLTDEIFVGTKTMRVLTGKPGVRQKQDGGATLRVPVEFGQNGTVKAQAPTDNYTITPNQVFDAAEFPWIYITGTMTFDIEERTKNTGKHAIFKLFEKKMENLKKSFRFAMNDFFFTGDGVLEPVGAQSAVSTTGTYGAIPRSGNTWWQSQVNSDVIALAPTTMRTIWNAAHANAEKEPDIVVTTVDLFEAYEDKVKAHLQVGNLQSGDLGFQSLRFKGADMFWDTHCPSGEMYILNSSYWQVWCHPQFEWSAEDPIQSDQPVKIYPIHWHGNYTCSGPRFQGKLSGKTVS